MVRDDTGSYGGGSHTFMHRCQERCKAVEGSRLPRYLSRVVATATCTRHRMYMSLGATSLNAADISTSRGGRHRIADLLTQKAKLGVSRV